ncbi:RluA family pseudouridine synthase [Desulfopila sp. IMCC35006]|uniref:RluA family pseudouridine synthase n=1 Tax=Desulfopila sp. IMCC35006 TaxID=2569542 RepID=UPI0010AC421F|nr:RluA family pseudouridine synthase [Desulfopila sp. IMCC35006]TKB27970.1 RluA family pseudouridine synthase [Desulfopila sp. IMCC35006]
METKEAALCRSSRSNRNFQVTIDTGLSGMRLDQFLAQHLPSTSRALIIASIRKGLILVDGVHRKSSYRLKESETLQGSVEGKQEIDVLPEHISFPVLFEDDSLLIISKPPGLVVHPGSGNHHGTLVNGLVHHCRSIADVGDSLRPGIVHRLDKDTSGIMVVAKTENVHRLLVDSFKNHQLHKEYLALVHGVLKEKNGRLVAPIGRHPVQRQKMAIRQTGGKHAASSWQVLEEFNSACSLVKVVIETGRTHQIRVHMAHLGCPVVGDTVYGSGRDNRLFPRQLLHASRLVFRHPVTDAVIDKKAELWPDFTDILKGLGASAVEENE